jgi:Concanavalin A-like lectin/glucanases superfamily
VTPLVGHTGEVGATWSNQAGNIAEQISSADGAYRNGVGFSTNYTTAAPPSADYNVEADIVVKTNNLSGDMAGVFGRLDTATNTFYMARWDSSVTRWSLVEVTAGTAATLATSTSGAITNGVTYKLRLNMIGSALKLYVDGVLTASATDATITAAGRAGIMDGAITTSPAKSASTGLHLDNFRVTPRAADSKGTNTGDYILGPSLGAPGVLAGDGNTAAHLDGVDDYVQMVATTAIPVLATARSIEMWFNTTSASRQVLFAYGTGVANQEFGLFLNAGSTNLVAWGWPAANDKTFVLPSAMNNGQWHQVVETFSTSVITIYIDGVALPTQAATRSTVMDAYGFVLGAAIRPADTGYTGGYFSGSLDEVSLYTTALVQATVTNHYQLGTAAAGDYAGPTGGSVDATGLAGTGSRYSASTTLTIALSAGTDPSGISVSGAQLLRATATLTSAGGTADGVCGAFGSYVLISGGTDPTSPKSDTVTDQACYSYQYVVSDVFGNTSTYTSPAIKVDTTSPSTPVLGVSAFTNTYWSSGTTVYYRSLATSGSFTVTATSTDAASGVSGFDYPPLGANWTSAPGVLGVNTYSWSGSPAAPGPINVTATNNAGVLSANSPVTLTADDAAPNTGTVTYPDGFTTALSTSVAFTTGTDAASGIGTRLLQRASAILTGTTCGTFSAYATLGTGTNPASPLADVIVRGNCYKYQYVVSDNVGNVTTATSANVIKVLPTYVSVVSGTVGLVSYWRVGEATTSSDTFTGTTGVTVQSRTGEIGSTWTRHIVSSDDAVITAAGRIRKNTASLGSLYYSSAVPASADYTIEADVFVATSLANDLIGVTGRLDTTVANGTFYGAVFDQVSHTWILYSVVNGNKVSLGSSATPAVTVGATYRLALDMIGTTIRMLVNGSPVVSVTNAAITAAGRAGFALGFGAANTTVTDTTGMQLDNFRVSPPMADSKGTNHGNYLGGPTLGVAGAIATDVNTAVQYDGVDTFDSVARQISNDFTIEFWFKSTQGIGTGTNWSSGAGLVDADVAGAANDFGVSLRSDGKIVAGVGGASDVSVISTLGSYNNGAWHHVVFARTMVSGALQLYVDGIAAGTATGSTVALTSPSNINFGRLQSGSNYFAGSLDEIAVYSTAVSQSTITEHYNAGL